MYPAPVCRAFADKAGWLLWQHQNPAPARARYQTARHGFGYGSPLTAPAPHPKTALQNRQKPDVLAAATKPAEAAASVPASAAPVLWEATASGSRHPPTPWPAGMALADARGQAS